VEFRDAYRILGDHLMVHGILDSTRWQFGSVDVDEITENVESLLRSGIVGKLFILSADSSSTPEIPLEKYHAVREIVRKYTW